MYIKNATYENGCLIIQTDKADAFKFVMDFAPAEYEIAKVKQKRSTNANAYAWALIRELARKTNVSPVQVYRYQVSQTAVRNSIISLPTEAIERMKEAWTAGHIGRDVIPLNESDGYTDALIVYGSSDYSREEMARFLDSIKADCEALGIETEDPNYISSLLQEWKSGQ